MHEDRKHLLAGPLEDGTLDQTDRFHAGDARPRRKAEPDLGFLAPPVSPGSLGRLGHYDILGVVGRGGFGVVLRAFDEKLHRVVALKVMTAGVAGDDMARQRFVREAQTAAMVRDDHVVHIYAVEDQPVPYLVMEFISGRTLQQKLGGGQPLPLHEVLRIGHQLAQGLAAAHALGLVHRDIKPANVLLEDGIERVKITDFGLARAVDDASLTQSGMIAGTPLYMSPEQAQSEPLDHRSDLFSLGSVLYAMCAGRPAFRAEGALAVLRRVCDEQPRPLRELNPDIPPWLEAVVSRLLAKDPADRFQSTREVADLLGRYHAEIQMHGRVSAPAPRRWGKALLLGLGGAAVVAGILLGCLYLPGLMSRETPPDPGPGPADSAGRGKEQVPGKVPPLAVAPFSAEKAREHQEAWAKFLGVPREHTNSVGMTFVLVPPGEFLMGTPPAEIESLVRRHRKNKTWEAWCRIEGPQRRVSITRPFFLAVHETTQKEYRGVVGSNPSAHSPTGEKKEEVKGLDADLHPVESVSWEDAAAFCVKLAEREGLTPCYQLGGGKAVPRAGAGYRLPTEAEWEYAARAGTATRYWTGQEADENLRTAALRHQMGCPRRTCAVGGMKPNPFGLHDTLGNVSEWCQDRYAPDAYARTPPEVRDPPGPEKGEERVHRGGSNLGSGNRACSPARDFAAAGLRSDAIGFRVVLPVEAVKANR